MAREAVGLLALRSFITELPHVRITNAVRVALEDLHSFIEKVTKRSE